MGPTYWWNLQETFTGGWIRTLLTPNALKLVYHSLVGSKLRYGLICWATAAKFLKNKVNTAHNKIITLLSFKKRCSKMWPLYCSLKLLPLEIMIKIEYGKTMYKFNNNLLPEVFEGYFSQPSHQHKTRFSEQNNFAFTLTSTAKENNLLRYMGPHVWRRDVPMSIRNSMSLKVFIKSLRNHLIGNFVES